MLDKIGIMVYTYTVMPIFRLCFVMPT